MLLLVRVLHKIHLSHLVSHPWSVRSRRTQVTKSQRAIDLKCLRSQVPLNVARGRSKLGRKSRSRSKTSSACVRVTRLKLSACRHCCSADVSRKKGHPTERAVTDSSSEETRDDESDPDDFVSYLSIRRILSQHVAPVVPATIQSAAAAPTSTSQVAAQLKSIDLKAHASTSEAKAHQLKVLTRRRSKHCRLSWASHCKGKPPASPKPAGPFFHNQEST